MNKLLLPKGYQDGEKSLEVLDGNIDVILYNESGEGFYFYRFKSELVLGESLNKQMNLVSRQQITELISSYGKDYDGLIDELIGFAIELNKSKKYDI